MTEYVGRGSEDGEVLFRTGGKGAFYGKTPVTQPAATAQSAVPTTAITTDPDTTTEFTAAINSLIARVAANTTLVNQIRSDLVTLGIIKGSN